MKNASKTSDSTRFTPIIAVAIAVAFCPLSSSAGDNWMAWPSTYTHDTTSGQRIDQYSQPVQPYGPSRNAIRRSGYRNTRSTLQAGQSADNYHLVEEWGAKVQPYEQWRFPYRPYGVPYNAWGPQAPYGFYNSVGPAFGFLPTQPSVPLAATPGAPTPTPVTPAPGTPTTPAFRNPGQQFFVPQNQINGFPLQPIYNNQPWFDGTYPQAPQLQNLRPGFRRQLPLRRPTTP